MTIIYESNPIEDLLLFRQIAKKGERAALKTASKENPDGRLLKPIETGLLLRAQSFSNTYVCVFRICCINLVLF